MSPYSDCAAAVEQIALAYPSTEPSVICYMIARSALLSLRSLQGSARAAEVAYKLGDEFAAETVTP